MIALTSETAFTLTRDRLALRSRLAGLLGRGDLLGGQFNLGISEALEIADGGRARLADAVLRECGRSLTEYVSTARAADDAAGRDSCPEQLEQQSRGLAQHAHAQARMSLAALEALIARLKDLPGPKTIVLLSEGMIVDPRRVDLSKLAADAQAARVTIYSLLLEIPLFDATQERVSPTADARSPGPRGRRRSGRRRGARRDVPIGRQRCRAVCAHHARVVRPATCWRSKRRTAIATRARTAFASRWPRGRHAVRARTHFTMPAGDAAGPRCAAERVVTHAVAGDRAAAARGDLYLRRTRAARTARRHQRRSRAADEGSAGAWLGFVLIDAAGVIAATATVESPSGQLRIQLRGARGPLHPARGGDRCDGPAGQRRTRLSRAGSAARRGCVSAT